MDDHRTTTSEATEWWSEVAAVREQIERRRAATVARRRSGALAADALDASQLDDASLLARPSLLDRPSGERDERDRLVSDRPSAGRATSDHGADGDEGEVWWAREPLPTHAGARRTVKIRGQAIPTLTTPALRLVDDDRHLARPSPDARAGGDPTRRRRPPARVVDRVGASPDRLAMWAVVFAIMLIVVAAMSAHS